MEWLQHWFHTGPVPENVISGTYNLYLVLLSYIIASFASYVALSLSSQLKKSTKHMFLVLLFSAAFVMGAGIWSMHFIGMLAFSMPMEHNAYDLFWTVLSMFVAIITAVVALLFFSVKQPRIIHYISCGILLGISIPMMHYTGMYGMMGVSIRYFPGLFVLSVVIAVVAAIAALWLVDYNEKTYSNRLLFKIISAMIMGLAIAGMHYTGMAAAVFTPAEIPMNGPMGESISDLNLDPMLLGFSIATVNFIILILALLLSIAYEKSQEE